MIRLSIVFSVFVLFLMSLPMVFGYGKCQSSASRICDDVGIAKSVGRSLASKFPMQMDGDKKNRLLNLVDDSKVLFSGRFANELRYSDSFGRIGIDMGADRGALNVVVSNMSEYADVPTSSSDVVEVDSKFQTIKGLRLTKNLIKPGTWVMGKGSVVGGVIVLNILYIPIQIK